MTGLVLHFGQQDRLAFQGRRAGDPIAFRQLADDLGMGMLGDLPDQGFAVAVGHPFLRLDLVAPVDARLKLAFGRAHLLGRLEAGGFHQLRVHGGSPIVET